MHIPRIYLDQEITLNQTLSLPKDIAGHLFTVLKRKVDSSIIVFNNRPDQNNLLGEYIGQIIEANKNKITLKVTEYISKNTKSKIPIELAQCISKPNHFDVTLQKAVELGVHTITPIISERSEVVRKENFANKFERWQKIVISACEQSGRTDIPILNQPIRLEDWLKINNHTNQLLLTMCTKTTDRLQDLKIKLADVAGAKVIIGAEGGLAPAEIDLLASHQFNLVKLGNRILRTETAGITILSIMQFMLGEF